MHRRHGVVTEEQRLEAAWAAAVCPACGHSLVLGEALVSIARGAGGAAVCAACASQPAAAPANRPAPVTLVGEASDRSRRAA